MTPLDVALGHATAGRAVFPCQWQGPKRKSPLTSNGLHDATLDPAVIAWWWRRWPQALIGARTGRHFGFVVLDIDIKVDRANGYDTLENLGHPILPDTPLVHTASGGLHIWFAPPADREIRNTTGDKGQGIGPGLDWRGEGGYVIVPSPDSGYSWDPHWHLDSAPLAEVPAGLMPREIVQQPQAEPPPIRPQPLCRYAEVALDGAVKAIVDAPDGSQQHTLNKEVYSPRPPGRRRCHAGWPRHGRPAMGGPADAHLRLAPPLEPRRPRPARPAQFRRRPRQSSRAAGEPPMTADYSEFEDIKAKHTGGSKANGASKDPRFKLSRFKRIELTTDPAYLIRDLIPKEGLVVVWGPPKCGKTFWTLDMVMHIPLGRDYRGRRVEQGAVVYVAAEGERGLRQRAVALRQERMTPEDDPPFYLLTTRLDLVADVDVLVGDIMAQLPADECCKAIVIDTLNRTFQGSESKDVDMTAYIRAADILRERFRCAVIIIHHCGISDNRPRGHTSLTGAVDAQIAVKRDVAGQIIATVEWMKDGEEGAEIVSKLTSIYLGRNDVGDPITSCVVDPVEDAVRSGSVAKLTPDERAYLGDIQNYFARAESPIEEVIPVSGSVSVRAATRVQIRDWLKRCGRFSVSSDVALSATDRTRLTNA